MGYYSKYKILYGEKNEDGTNKYYKKCKNPNLDENGNITNMEEIITPTFEDGTPVNFGDYAGTNWHTGTIKDPSNLQNYTAGNNMPEYIFVYKILYYSKGDGAVTVKKCAEDSNEGSAVIKDYFSGLSFIDGSYYEEKSYVSGQLSATYGNDYGVIDIDTNNLAGATDPGNVARFFWANELRFYCSDSEARAINIAGNITVEKWKMSVRGNIFIDKYGYNKDTRIMDGYMGDGDEVLNEPVKVELYRVASNEAIQNGQLISERVVTNGSYQFNDLDVFAATSDTFDYYSSAESFIADKSTYYKYYVRFVYNGQVYETTVQTVNWDATYNTGNSCIEGGGAAFHNLERADFNSRYKDVKYDLSNPNISRMSTETKDISNNNLLSGNSNVSDAGTYLMDAGINYEILSTNHRVHSNEDQGSKAAWVNLGVIKRYFDLNLTTSLESMNVSINGVAQTFKGFGSPTITANITSADLSEDKLSQKLAVQESDYKADDIEKPLEVWVNYKVRVSNESVAYYSDATVDIDCDNRFSAFKVNDGSEMPLPNNSENNSPTVIKLGTFTLNDIESSKEINISMKLDRDTIKNIMEKNGTDFVRTLEFVAEIGEHTSYYNDNAYGKGYTKGTIAGKLDEDSIPGNFNINAYNSCNSTVERKNLLTEDDIDRAYGVQLIKQGEGNSRKITGIVFEDATSQHDKDVDGNGVDNNKIKLRYGNGKYDEGGIDPKDKTIEGVEVKVIDNTSGKTYEDISKTDGKYTIENVIPSANYTIEFTYGDGTQKQYNSQDYKSTIDMSKIKYTVKDEGTDSNGNKIAAIGADNYWYSKARNNSVAKDKNKGEINNESINNESMTYETAVALENYKDDTNSNLKLSNTATTAEFMVPITEYGKDSSGNATFTIENMNFGLAEKPRSELTINKVVDHVTITTSDGRTLIDGTQGAINSTSWTDRYVQAIVDENLIYGSTLKITYKYYVTNTGEVDIAPVAQSRFYDYGVINYPFVIKTKADKIIDYVDNSLMYDEKMQANPEDANKKNKDYWKTAEDSDLELLGNEAKNGASNINTKLVTTGLSEDLVPGQSTGPIYLTLSKVLSSSEDKGKNALTYNNYAEIIQATNQLGRRSYHTTTTPNNSEKDNYTTKEVRDDNGRITGFQITNTGNDKNILLSDVVNRGAPVADEKMKQSGKQLVLSIPGDLDMSKLSAEETTLYWEPDSDIDLAGGSVQIVPPFGSQRVIWIIIATVSTTILAVGIILIKKKVLK